MHSSFATVRAYFLACLVILFSVFLYTIYPVFLSYDADILLKNTNSSWCGTSAWEHDNLALNYFVIKSPSGLIHLKGANIVRESSSDVLVSYGLFQQHSVVLTDSMHWCFMNLYTGTPLSSIHSSFLSMYYQVINFFVGS